MVAWGALVCRACRRAELSGSTFPPDRRVAPTYDHRPPDRQSVKRHGV